MNKQPSENQPRKETRNASAGRGFLIVAVVAGIVGLILWAAGLKPGGTGKTDSATEPSGTNAARAAGEPKPAFQRLAGRWLRPDGGYVIEIRSADEAGKLDVAYFNPDPIHVARAEASGQGSMIKVFIELRDVNYPGCTYTLAYDPATDVLKGIYYQAAIQQQFEVYFERLK